MPSDTSKGALSHEPPSAVLGSFFTHTIRIAERVGGLGIIGLMLLISADVALRTLTGRGVVGGLEFGEMLLASVVFLGMASAERDKVHVSTQIVADRLPPRVVGPLFVSAYVVAVTLLTLMAGSLILRAVKSFTAGESRYGVAAVATWPARALVALGALLLAAEVVRTTVSTIGDLRTGRR